MIKKRGQDFIHIPRRVFVVGASGSLGRRFIAESCGAPACSPGRLAILVRDRASLGEFRLLRTGNADLTHRGALKGWLRPSIDAVLYLAGVPASTAQQAPERSRRVNVDGFRDVLRWASARSGHRRVVYASSTAACSGLSLRAGAYARHKLAAERALISSKVAGIALRLPTLLPRPEGGISPTAFLNEAVQRALHREPFIWPIDFDRRVVVMSVGAAAGHLQMALSLPTAGPKVVTLHATVLTARVLCEATATSKSVVQLTADCGLDDAMRRRSAHVHCQRALVQGFEQAESLQELLNNFVNDTQMMGRRHA